MALEREKEAVEEVEEAEEAKGEATTLGSFFSLTWQPTLKSIIVIPEQEGVAVMAVMKMAVQSAKVHNRTTAIDEVVAGAEEGAEAVMEEV